MAIILNISENSGMPYEKRNKNVLYQADEFKIRIIDLPENGSVPPCEMVTYVVFTVMQGEVIIMGDGVPHHLSKKQSLVSEPALFSMKSSIGAKLMGIQKKKGKTEGFMVAMLIQIVAYAFIPFWVQREQTIQGIIK